MPCKTLVNIPTVVRDEYNNVFSFMVVVTLGIKRRMNEQNFVYHFTRNHELCVSLSNTRISRLVA